MPASGMWSWVEVDSPQISGGAMENETDRGEDVCLHQRCERLRRQMDLRRDHRARDNSNFEQAIHSVIAWP